MPTMVGWSDAHITDVDRQLLKPGNRPEVGHRRAAPPTKTLPFRGSRAHDRIMFLA
jgi:hypothetical protein